MKYIAKGMVVTASTENMLHVTRCGCDFQLTGIQANLWLNGRFGFSEIKEKDFLAAKELRQLKRQELVELADADDAGEYRALTQCVIMPAQAKGGVILTSREKELLKWIVQAGLRLSMAELTFLMEKRIAPTENFLGDENRHALTEAIYTQETIFDNILDAQMEHARSRDTSVGTVLSLLKKKRIILL